ncbi:FAD-binding oxidoreductase [Frankia sp. R82]|uniref:NAD(P)/FAD-dependent oxidoreductase n=1 Tax=Frankia sp. R82 TaxID=2950553 RepID=UPI00204479E4|nr:FAD-dependent oxidoreductase [Frankia sp. R82]MCM3887064.1 FAD-binding oxidoreductase [Frankia sp. R82]
MHNAPDRVAIIGGGMVGLCVAWFLQERGVRVTVFDRDQLTSGVDPVGAGSSWGNAGWLTPGLATPLPDPAVLRYGLRVLWRADSPVYVPPVADARLARFVAGFVRHSTHRRWQLAMRALAPLTTTALEAFDVLHAGGVRVRTRAAAPFLAGYRERADLDELLRELDGVRAAGQPVDAEVLDPLAAHDLEPLLSPQVRHVVQVHGQRYLDPGRFVAALADAVRERGGRIHESTPIHAIHAADATHAAGAAGTGRVVISRSTADGHDADGNGADRPGGADGPGADEEFDAVVVATGAWLPRLAGSFGVRVPVQAGRGYSFQVATPQAPSGPIYFPASRVACTPVGDGLRVAGMMEFRRPDAPADPRRIRAVVEAARGLLTGVDLDVRTHEWVGPRPCTSDGLPLIGRTASPRVFVAGGHGMWGITLGPVTGQLLADAIVSGTPAAALAPFDPLR